MPTLLHTLGPRRSAPLLILLALILITLLHSKLSLPSSSTSTLYPPWLVADPCASWDPLAPEASDPVGCTRARQYRQVQRVLEREQKSEHDHWWFTKEHNIATLESLLRCFLPPRHSSHVSCPTRPLVITGWWYTALVLQNATSGETIWMNSVIEQLEDLGFYWIAVGPYINWIAVVEMMPDVYRTVWMPDVDAVSCITDPRCIAKEHYVPPIDADDLSVGIPDDERGVIPIWALTVVDYWGARPKEISNNDHWPWPLPGDHVHLPYSIEKTCLALPHVSHENRNDSVLILAKRSSYFDHHQVSPRGFWTHLANDTSGALSLITTAKEERGHPTPGGLFVLPPQSRDEYEALVGNVKALLGVGAPYQSPSVYSALCQGTPVIVPYFLEHTRQDGWYMYSGHAQHGPAASLGEPYVYTYYAQNYTSLFLAAQKAVSTPIEGYIPPNMRYAYALDQLRTYLDRDTRGVFERVVERNGGIPRLIAGVRERCYELDRCRPTLPPGRKPHTLQDNHADHP